MTCIRLCFLGWDSTTAQRPCTAPPNGRSGSVRRVRPWYAAAMRPQGAARTVTCGLVIHCPVDVSCKLCSRIRRNALSPRKPARFSSPEPSKTMPPCWCGHLIAPQAETAVRRGCAGSATWSRTSPCLVCPRLRCCVVPQYHNADAAIRKDCHCSRLDMTHNDD